MTTKKPTIVFCHGIWADGSCFSKVIPALQADGHEVIAVQYGLESYKEDRGHRKADAQPRRQPGHARRPFLRRRHHHRRRHGRARGRPGLHRGGRARRRRDRAGPAQQVPVGHLHSRRGRRQPRLDASDRHRVLRRRPVRKKSRSWCGRRHYAPVFDLFHQQKLTPNSIAWRSKPSWYVLATQDHTVHPDLQRWVSKRMGAKVTEVASSHVPMLSQPDVVIDVIRKAVAAVQNG